MISDPEGSFMVLSKCTAHKFVTWTDPTNPAILLIAFGQSLTAGDSSGDLSKEMDAFTMAPAQSPTSGATTASIGLMVLTFLWLVLSRKSNIGLAFVIFVGNNLLAS